MIALTHRRAARENPAMATVPMQPATRDAAQAVRLDPFDPRHAALVASWVRDAREAFQLAPRTPPPMTAERIAQWGCEPGHMALQLVEVGRDAPVAYGEVNLLNPEQGEYWLGHLLVDPARRGERLGFELTRQLVHRAFARLAARRVSLVVFPDNERAISVYKAAGFFPDGFELHEFPAYGLQERLLRMTVTADSW